MYGLRRPTAREMPWFVEGVPFCNSQNEAVLTRATGHKRKQNVIYQRESSEQAHSKHFCTLGSEAQSDAEDAKRHRAGPKVRFIPPGSRQNTPRTRLTGSIWFDPAL